MSDRLRSEWPTRYHPMKLPAARWAAALFCAYLLSPAVTRSSAAAAPGVSLVATVDLSEGPDCYGPYQVLVNHTTHRLYVPGSGTNVPLPLIASHAIKVIDTTTNSAIAGVDLGYYEKSGSKVAFRSFAATIDESVAPLGNKLYILGSGDDNAYVIRVIDGVSNTNETTELTDILLPESGLSPGNYIITANPVNHKVYVVDSSSRIVVIDGPKHKVLATLQPSLGLSDKVMVTNPIANKVFALTYGSCAVIDSTNDTYTTISFPLYPRAAVFDPLTNRIFVAASQNLTTGDAVLYALDGSSGAIINSVTITPGLTRSITVDSVAGIVYLTQPFSPFYPPGQIGAYATSDLSAQGTHQVGGTSLALDGSAATARLYMVASFFDPAGEWNNKVAVFHPTDGQVETITVGYSSARLAVNPRTNRLYRSDDAARELTALDGESHEIVAHIATQPGDVNDYNGPAADIGVSLATNKIFVSRYVSNSGSFIDIYDGATIKAIGSISVDDDDFTIFPYISVDDTRRRIYVPSGSDRPDHLVKAFSLDNYSLIDTLLNVTNAADNLANPITGLLYFSTGQLYFANAPLSVVAPSTDTVLNSIPGGFSPGSLAADLRTNRIFAVDSANNQISVIDGATSQLETTIPNPFPDGSFTSVSVDDLTHTVYASGVTGFADAPGIIAVFDGNKDYAYVGQIDVGPAPGPICFNTATREIVVNDSRDGTIRFLQSSTPGLPDRLANISTRLGVRTGDDVLIGGFIISGPAGSTKQVLIRGIGPSLTAFGVAGALADPLLELHNGSSIIATNDNWKLDQNGMSQQTAIEATSLQPSNDHESSILTNLTPGSYTAVMRGLNDGTGVGLVEVYDVSASDTIKMVNISTRGRVETGDSVMIGGIIVTGSDPSRVLLRAIGPSLGDFGVTSALADPVLELYNSDGDIIVTNDNWQAANKDAILATGLAPANDKESAILTTLYPSSYTAIVRGQNDSTGVGLVEAYYLP